MVKCLVRVGGYDGDVFEDDLELDYDKDELEEVDIVERMSCTKVPGGQSLMTCVGVVVQAVGVEAKSHKESALSKGKYVQDQGTGTEGIAMESDKEKDGVGEKLQE
ncbi:hypothetical protein NDU88_003326 [Pleurodeles waltl]|uniref:Uncharacterized protein n=1 Tax=Pleurodeles waltl TaxID=8319 RepID=A0AAV7UZT0_PLEWA|nr:hypothetical protein NDU88_003326 [Pleurodeles waltl]